MSAYLYRCGLYFTNLARVIVYVFIVLFQHISFALYFDFLTFLFTVSIRVQETWRNNCVRKFQSNHFEHEKEKVDIIYMKKYID